jgi:hypothetical protein
VASNNLVIDQKDVKVNDEKGLLKTHNDSNTGSGGTARRSFCSNCGRQELSHAASDLLAHTDFHSPIYAIPTDSDEQYVLFLGIFPRIPQPAFELFAAHRHPWQPPVPGATQYKFMTSSGELEQ